MELFQVEPVVDKEDIAVGPHDVVVPSLASSVSDGDHISVRYGRKLTVTVDGATKEALKALPKFEYAKKK